MAAANNGAGRCRRRLIQTEENGVRLSTSGAICARWRRRSPDAFNNELDRRARRRCADAHHEPCQRPAQVVEPRDRRVGRRLRRVRLGGSGPRGGSVTMQARRQVRLALADRQRGGRSPTQQAQHAACSCAKRWSMSEASGGGGPSCRYMSTTPWRSSCTSLDFEQIEATVTLLTACRRWAAGGSGIPAFFPSNIGSRSTNWLPASSTVRPSGGDPCAAPISTLPLDQQAMEWFWQVVERRSVYRRCIQTSRRFEAALILSAQRWNSAHEMDLWVRQSSTGDTKRCWRSGRWLLWPRGTRAPVTINLKRDHSAAWRRWKPSAFARNRRSSPCGGASAPSRSSALTTPFPLLRQIQPR